MPPLPRPRTLVLAAAALSLVATGFLVLRDAEEPDELAQLERAERAGDRAQTQSERIEEALLRIAENLEAGSRLTEQSAQIHDLTERQQASLRDLADLLRDQLAVLERSRSHLEGSRTSTAGLAEVSEAQAALIADAVGSLQQLRGYVASATASSADLAHKAEYGARLAKDSQRRFDQ